MRRFERLFTTVAVVLGLALLSAPSSASSDARQSEYSELRGLVDRTQSDLQAASGLNHGGKQTDRYHKTQDHLSKLDKSLAHGKYSKGAMNDSIDGIKSILDHNTLQARARDALSRDLTDLKIARDRH